MIKNVNNISNLEQHVNIINQNTEDRLLTTLIPVQPIRETRNKVCILGSSIYCKARMYPSCH